MASFRLLDLPSELRLQVYRSFFEQKLIQVVAKLKIPEGRFRPVKFDTRNLLLAGKEIYDEARSACVNHAIFVLDLCHSSEPFFIAKRLGLRNVMIERGFIQLFPPQPPFRDMLPPYRQTKTFSDETLEWNDIEEWRAQLQRCIVRFDLYLHVRGKGSLLLEKSMPFNYIPRIATAWDTGLGGNMTVEFYGRNIQTQYPAVIVTGDRKVKICSRELNSVEEDCLMRKILCLLDVEESERLKCGHWDENPIQRY